MQGGHGALGDSALEPVAHDQLRSVPQLGQHFVQPLEVVGIVRVAHDDEAAAGGADAADQGRAIAAVEHAHHPRAFRFGERL